MKSSWLKEHITALIALIITLAFVVINVLVLIRDVRSDDKVTFLILANIYGALAFILGYYFAATKRATHLQDPSPSVPSFPQHTPSQITPSHEKQND